MNTGTRQDQLATLQDIRIGDLPAPLYVVIAELLAQFAEGTLYDANTDAVSQEALRVFEERLRNALEAVMFKQLPLELQRLADAWVERNKMRTGTR